MTQAEVGVRGYAVLPGDLDAKVRVSSYCRVKYGDEMAPVALQCTVVDCEHGEDRGSYRTERLEPDMAFRLLAIAIFKISGSDTRGPWG